MEKAKALFVEKFFDESRYRLGRVGRFRINRKFDLNSPEDMMFIRAEDFLRVVQYMLDLRSNRLDPKTGRPVAQVDDIDHLGNRRLRTLDELAVEELRKGFLQAPAHGPGAHERQGPRRDSPRSPTWSTARASPAPSTSSSGAASSRRSSTRPTRSRRWCTSGALGPRARRRDGFVDKRRRGV